MAGFTGTKTQEDIKKNEENKKKKTDEKKNTASDKDNEMFSLSYDEAKSKYEQGVGNNKRFMSKSDFDKRQKELGLGSKKEQSLVANQFGEKKGKTWNDVVAENGNDPEKMANWLNNNPDYKAGELTKKGMSDFGYKQDENGKWGKDDTVTNDKVIDELDNIAIGNAAVKSFVDNVTNAETGDVDEEKAKGAIDKYEQKLVEAGAATYDENGNFVLNNVNTKGWEDWATVLSAGLSVLGLAFGVPIMPINFRKITNKDKRDAKIMELQQQYMDIKAGNAGKVEDVKSSAEAGKFAKNNKEDIDAYSEYTEDVGGYKAKSDIDTDSEKELIDKNLEAEKALVEAEFKNKIGEMKLAHEQEKDLQVLMSNLAESSAKELINQEKYGYLVDMTKAMKDAGMDDRAVALKLQSLAGITPTAQNIKHAERIVGMATDIIDSTSNLVPGNGKNGD